MSKEPPRHPPHRALKGGIMAMLKKESAKEIQTIGFVTEFVHVATLIQRGCPLWSEYIARVNFHYKLYEFHFGTENMLPRVIFREVGDMGWSECFAILTILSK